jgi:hypothetical protein
LASVHKYFFVVESRAPLSDPVSLENITTDTENFRTEFIRASHQDCQNWALENQFKHSSIVQDLIAVIDARSTSDDTILLYSYPRVPIEFRNWGVLPKEHNTWYGYRINYKNIVETLTSLQHFGPMETIFPTYFGRKAELTDDQGIFNAERALALVRGEDREFLRL